MALPPVPQFSAAVQGLLSDGFEPIRALVITKGPHQAKVMHNAEDGAVAAMLSSSRPLGSGTVEGALASDGMLYVTLAPHVPVEGLSVRIDSAGGRQGVLPVAGVEASFARPSYTLAASASPAAGIVASVTTGADPFLVGAAAMVQPDGRRNTLVGATIGGAITALATVPSEGPVIFHQSAVLQPTPQTMVGAMVEWSLGREPTVAAGAAVSLEGLGLTLKSMVIKGAAERPEGPEAFAVSKLAAVAASERGLTVGASLELPLRLPSDAPAGPKWGCMLGISLP